SLEERTGTRDLTYSRWHRPKSIRRYLSVEQAAKLTVIDIDWCEACWRCAAPLALIETQRSTKGPKNARIMTELAKLAQLPAFSVGYHVGEVGGEEDCIAFYVTQLWPYADARRVVTMTAQQYAEWLWSLRSKHECAGEAAA